MPEAPTQVPQAESVASPAAAPAKPAAGDPSIQWWVLTAIGIGTFVSALDGSVVNTIQPLLVRAFSSSVATVEWVLTVYLLVVSGLLLTTGRVGDMYGHKPVFMSGFGLFLVASALCGISPSAEWLIGFRVLQAVGASMLYASGPAIITQNFPPERRGQALGIQLTMAYVGLTLGPLLGGWLAQHFGWGAVFFINVPIGIPAIVISAKYIPAVKGAESGKRFDLAGAVLFMIGLTALLVALNQGHAWGWSSGPILGLFAVAVVVLAAFFSLESRIQFPMLDLSLFRNRLFSFASISALLNYIGLYSTLFLIPYYLNGGRGYSYEHVGLVLAAQPVAMAAIASFSGTISDKIGTRWPTSIGMAILAGGLFLLSGLGPDTPVAQVVIGLVLAGLGTGMFVSPNNSAMLGTAPKERRGIASGIMATARNIGMVLGIGLAGAIFTSITHGHAMQDKAALFEGVRAGFLGAAIVAAIGIVTSFIRE